MGDRLKTHGKAADESIAASTMQGGAGGSASPQPPHVDGQHQQATQVLANSSHTVSPQNNRETNVWGVSGGYWLNPQGAHLMQLQTAMLPVHGYQYQQMFQTNLASPYSVSIQNNIVDLANSLGGAQSTPLSLSCLPPKRKTTAHAAATAASEGGTSHGRSEGTQGNHGSKDIAVSSENRSASSSGVSNERSVSSDKAGNSGGHISANEARGSKRSRGFRGLKESDTVPKIDIAPFPLPHKRKSPAYAAKLVGEGTTCDRHVEGTKGYIEAKVNARNSDQASGSINVSKGRNISSDIASEYVGHGLAVTTESREIDSHFDSVRPSVSKGALEADASKGSDSFSGGSRRKNPDTPVIKVSQGGSRHSDNGRNNESRDLLGTDASRGSDSYADDARTSKSRDASTANILEGPSSSDCNIRYSEKTSLSTIHFAKESDVSMDRANSNADPKGKTSARVNASTSEDNGPTAAELTATKGFSSFGSGLSTKKGGDNNESYSSIVDRKVPDDEISLPASEFGIYASTLYRKRKWLNELDVSTVLAPRTIGSANDRIFRQSADVACDCKDNKCLRMTCSCFTLGRYCGPNCSCRTRACSNGSGMEDMSLERRNRAVHKLLSECSEGAFRDHEPFAKCGNIYCDCFQSGVYCDFRHCPCPEKCHRIAVTSKRYFVDPNTDSSQPGALNSSAHHNPSGYIMPLRADNLVANGVCFTRADPRFESRVTALKKPQKVSQKLFHNLMLTPSKSIRPSQSERRISSVCGTESEQNWKAETRKMMSFFAHLSGIIERQLDNDDSMLTDPDESSQENFQSIVEDMESVKNTVDAAKLNIMTVFYERRKGGKYYSHFAGRKKIQDMESDTEPFDNDAEPEESMLRCNESMPPVAESKCDLPEGMDKVRQLIIRAVQDTAMMRETARIIRRKARELARTRSTRES